MGGTIKVHAGDFLNEPGSFHDGILTLKTKERPNGVDIRCCNYMVETLELASEENVKKIGGTIGWGAVGGLVLGPVGLLAGLMLGGRKKEVTFIIKFKDGRKLLATTDNATYVELQAAVF